MLGRGEKVVLSVGAELGVVVRGGAEWVVVTFQWGWKGGGWGSGSI